jgi:phosphotransferase system HPr-like phosphotransfer protein
MLLLILICGGGALVLLVRGDIIIPPGVIAALTGGTSPVTIQAVTVLDKIQSLSDLTLTRFSYSSVITSQRDLPPVLAGLYGDKLVMVAVGHVNAGIDLRKLTTDSITGNADAMTIQLPPPQLLDCFLNEQASYVISRETGVFARPAPNLDQEAKRYAVRQFREMAVKDEILDQVQKNAQSVIQVLVTNLGVKSVTIVTTPPDPNATLPESCQ